MSIALGTSIEDAARDGLVAAASAGVQIRELGELAELDEVYRLYNAIWRPDPKNPPVTTELLRALTKAGNYVAGAYDGDQLIGACMGFFAAPAEGAMHSHVAGVSGAARGRNVGFALKLHQRAWALQRGVTAISWTFDPLIRRNAYFNVTKLAARPVEYLANFYGLMHDGINNGDDSDRLLVRWELNTPEVAAAAARATTPPRPGPPSAPTRPGPPSAPTRSGPPSGPNHSTTAGPGTSAHSAFADSAQYASAPAPPLPQATVALACGEDGRPLAGSSGLLSASASAAWAPSASASSGETVLVGVPADVEGLRQTDPAAAKEWRTALREVLGGLMADGARVTGFDRAGWYVLEQTGKGLV